MKINYLLTILLLTISYSYAQEGQEYGFNKGDFFVSGTINHEDSNLLFSQLSIGHFINSNIALGVQSKFLINEASNFNELSSFGAGIHGKYFFTPTKRFSFFGEVALDYTTSTGHSNNGNGVGDNSSIQSNNFSPILSGGFNFFITPKLSLYAKYEMIRYDINTVVRNTNGGVSKDTNSTIEASQGLKNLNYGILYKF